MEPSAVTAALGTDLTCPTGVIGVAVPWWNRGWAADATLHLLDVWGRERTPALLANLYPWSDVLDERLGSDGSRGLTDVLSGERSFADVAVKSDSGTFAYLPFGQPQRSDPGDAAGWGERSMFAETREQTRALLESGALRALSARVRRADGLLVLFLPFEAGQDLAGSGLLDGFVAFGDDDPGAWSRIHEVLRIPHRRGRSRAPSDGDSSTAATGAVAIPRGRPPGWRAARARAARWASGLGQLLVVLLILVSFVVGIVWLLDVMSQEEEAGGTGVALWANPPALVRAPPTVDLPPLRSPVNDPSGRHG